MHTTSFDHATSIAISAQSVKRMPRKVTGTLMKSAVLSLMIWSGSSFAASLFSTSFGSLVQVTVVQTDPVKTDSSNVANVNATPKENQDKKRDSVAKDPQTTGVHSMRSTDNKDTKLKIVIM